MSFSTIVFMVEGGVAVITLSREDRLNAWNHAMMTDLIAAFDRVDADDTIRAVIVTGAGRAFCAGADLAGGAATFDYAADGSALVTSSDEDEDLIRDTGGRLTLRIFECRKPVIAAVNGPAVGIGATMLLPMDIRLASTSARFGFVFTRRGIVPEAASAWFLPRIVGISRALAWTLRGRIVSADEAHAAGLVAEVYAPEALLGAACAIAAEIAEQTAPVAVALTRQLMWHGLTAPHPMDIHRIDSRAVYDLGKSDDAREGVMSFLEKRAPNFAGRVSSDMPDVLQALAAPDYQQTETRT